MLVDDLIVQVRTQVDEDNDSDISDNVILTQLNRAQNKLVRLASQRMNSIFKRESPDLTPTGREVTIPEGAFGLQINEVFALRGSTPYRVEPAELRQLIEWESNEVSGSGVPVYYAQVGDKLRLYPAPAGVTIRVRYQFRPPDLVKSQGRITSIDTVAGEMTLDALGSDLTTSIAQLKAFVNVVDRTTGLIKATLQVNGIDESTTTVSFKSAGLDRATVFGQTVGTEIPATVTLDDYLALANGTCIPTLLQDYYDYLVQFAVLEIRRKTQEDSQADYAALKELERDIMNIWAGRENSRRVTRTNPFWGGGLVSTRRFNNP